MENKENVQPDITNIQQLTPEQKKTIWEWIKYLGKTIIVAIYKKLRVDKQ